MQKEVLLRSIWILCFVLLFFKNIYLFSCYSKKSHFSKVKSMSSSCLSSIEAVHLGERRLMGRAGNLDQLSAFKILSIRSSAKQCMFTASSPGRLALPSGRFTRQADTRQVPRWVGSMAVVCFSACHLLSHKYLSSECGDVSFQRASGAVCVCRGCWERESPTEAGM